MLMSFQPKNFSFLIGVLTNGSIFLCILLILKRPIDTIYFLSAGILMIILRSFTLYILPLEPPPMIIPLKDPILEMTFYKGKVLLKDLFFSGHTANIILMGLLTQNIVIKRSVIFLGFLVGLLLLLQHVHYSIDVMAAPVFAVLIYKSGIKVGNRIFDVEDDEEIKRCGNIAVELGFRKN